MFCISINIYIQPYKACRWKYLHSFYVFRPTSLEVHFKHIQSELQAKLLRRTLTLAKASRAYSESLTFSCFSTTWPPAAMTRDTNVFSRASVSTDRSRAKSTRSWRLDTTACSWSAPASKLMLPWQQTHRWCIHGNIHTHAEVRLSPRNFVVTCLHVC